MADPTNLNTGAGADTIGVTLPADTLAPDTEAPRLTGDEIILRAQRVGSDILGPSAQDADRATGPTLANFDALAEAGLLGLAIPVMYGGLDARGAVQRHYTAILSSYCGVTTFIQAQHHGASRMIANGSNNLLKSTLLPALAAGKRMCAISFAHLRRPGPPVLRAAVSADGCRLSGVAPWVTGWGLMDQVVFGATLPDESFIYVWSPADRNQYPTLFDEGAPTDGNWGAMRATPPIPLCTMNASATVALELENWFVPHSHILSYSTRETMQRNDRNGVLGATAMPVGCAVAGVRLLCETADKKSSLSAIRRAANSFAAELDEVKNQIELWIDRSGEEDFFENAVRIRAWCIELALRTAHAAITAVSGSANALDHPAQRLIREAMFYTVQAQTREVMDATLARLERPV